MPPTATHKKWKYDPHPSVQFVRNMVAGMEEKTGRSLEGWLSVVKREGPAAEKDCAAWLKQKHGLGTNYASWIAGRATGANDVGDDADEYLRHAEDYVEAMYAGEKERLRPIYDEILSFAKRLGRDIRLSPCQTMVPIYRNHVIAQVKPTTPTRIDLGLALKDTKVPKRLIDTGGFAKKDRITHRLEITSLHDFDDEAKRWMRVAYDMDE